MIDNAEDLDIVMPMYELLEFGDNYSIVSRSLRNYYGDELNDDINENNDACNYRINKSKTKTSKYFQYKTKIIGKTPDDNTLGREAVVPLKYLTNSWRSRDLL